MALLKPNIFHTKWLWSILGSVAVAACIVIAGITWPSKPAHSAIAIDNYSQNAVACLAYDSGTDSPDSSNLWKAMQTVGTENLNLQQLAIPGNSPSQAQPYLSGLVATRVQMIITVGKRLATTAQSVATGAPETIFLAIGAPSEETSTRNLVVLTGSQTLIESALQTRLRLLAAPGGKHQ